MRWNPRTDAEAGASIRRQARNYHWRARRPGDARLLGKWSSGSGSRGTVGSAGPVRGFYKPTETPQLRDGELSDDSSQYAQCKAGANFIEATACSASFAWNVNFAVDRLAVETGIQLFTHSLSLGALLNLINTTLWAEDAVTSITDLRESPLSFSISPTSSSSTQGANAGTGSASPTAGAPAPAPSSASASPQFYVYYVYHTCANGACGLNLRSGPGYSNYPVTRVLVDGDAVDIVCQTQGQSVSGIDGSSSDVWDKTIQGDYAADFYVDTPGMTGSFSPPIPQC